MPQDVAVAGSAEEGFRRYAYVPLWIGGLPVLIQDPQTGVLDPELELRFPIGEGDENCNFDEGGVSTNCWAWAIDEHHELLGVTYGVTSSPLAGGFQLISMPMNAVDGEELEILSATPLPEPHLLLLQAVGVLAVAGLGRLRRRRQPRRPAF